MAKLNDYVMIHLIVLGPEDRAPQVPDDTKAVPLELWAKGFLKQESAELGDVVTIETITGRSLEGELVEVSPTYRHSFGEFVPEILQIGLQLKSILFGGDHLAK